MARVPLDLCLSSARWAYKKSLGCAAEWVVPRAEAWMDREGPRFEVWARKRVFPLLGKEQVTRRSPSGGQERERPRPLSRPCLFFLHSPMPHTFMCLLSIFSRRAGQ